MKEQKESRPVTPESRQTAVHYQTPEQSSGTITLSVPRPNIQVIILALVALVTLFQTFQLVRISLASSESSVKPAVVQPATSGTTATDAPQEMVGGC